MPSTSRVRFSIELIARTIIPHGPDQLCRTLLVLGPFHPPLDAHAFTTVAANSGNGGGWVVGNG